MFHIFCSCHANKVEHVNVILKAGFLDIKGRIPPPKWTNFWKSAKWEGPIFKPKKNILQISQFGKFPKFINFGEYGAIPDQRQSKIEVEICSIPQRQGNEAFQTHQGL